MKFEFRQLSTDDPAVEPVFIEALEVMRAAFAGLEGRIDPPSSLGEITVSGLMDMAAQAEVWVAGAPVVGTVILTPKAKVLQVGKLAVQGPRCGVGRALLDLAETRAVALGLGWLEL